MVHFLNFRGVYGILLYENVYLTLTMISDVFEFAYIINYEFSYLNFLFLKEIVSAKTPSL